MKAQVTVVVVTALVLASCEEASPPPAAPVPPPPAIAEVSPEPRSTGVRDDAGIRVQFSEAMDPTTLSPRNVSVRVDERYVDVRLAWDPQTWELRIDPVDNMVLSRTHTVRLETGIRSAKGLALTSPYWWQFTTIGIRSPRAPWPPNDTDGESPFVRLAWQHADVGEQQIQYLLFANVDSAKVAERIGGPIAATTAPLFLPTSRWPQGVRNYWAVTARNLSTGEQVDGPVWSFRTFSTESATETVELPLSDWSFLTYLGDQLCFGASFETGGEVSNCAIRWDLRPLGPRKLASAQMVLGQIGTSSARTNVYSSNDWRACFLQTPGPPHSVSLMGSGVSDGTAITVASDVLTAHLEATMRYRGYFGYVLSSSAHRVYPASQCRLVLTLYREGAAN